MNNSQSGTGGGDGGGAAGFAGACAVSEGGLIGGVGIAPGDPSSDLAFMIMGGYEEAEIPDGMGSLVGNSALKLHDHINLFSSLSALDDPLPSELIPWRRHVPGNAVGWCNSRLFIEGRGPRRCFVPPAPYILIPSIITLFPLNSYSLPASRKRHRGGRRCQAECGSGAAVSHQVQNGQ